jgi:hypothetical protein
VTKDQVKIDQQAREAAAAFIRRALGFIVRRGERGELLGQASGTLWLSARKTPVVLTCWHSVGNHGSFSIGTPQGPQIRLRDAVAAKHPTDDVAIIRLPAHELSTHALDASVLADAKTLTKNLGVVVAGFPDHLSFEDSDERGRIQQLGMHTYFGITAGSDARSISIQWKEGVSSEADAAPFRHLGVKAGLQPMKKPIGISGGAAWLWDRGEVDKLWTPTLFRFVGVPYEFTNQRQLAVPVWRWRDWLLERLNE